MSQNDRTLGLVGNAAFKVPVKAASTANLTLTGEQTVDGRALVSGDRVLVKNQTAAEDNGIWVVDSGAWTRSQDFDGAYDAVQGTLVMVLGGSTNPNTYWRLDTADGFVIGTDDLTFVPALLTDAALASFIQAGLGAVARNLQAKIRETFSVKDFGATGDGVTDDSAAILACVNAAAAQTVGGRQSVAEVYFPPGLYIIATTAPLTPTIATSIRAGIHFRGAGMNTSILRLAPTGTDLYFYNNVATPREQFCTFANLGFQGMDPANLVTYADISNNAKGFRLRATTATGSHEQSFWFHQCDLGYLNQMFETAGDNTASECYWSECHFHHIKSKMYALDNLQSFNHEFHACTAQVLYGDVFELGANGGGAIKIYGGSWIMFSDTGVDTYFLRTIGATGLNGQPFTVNGVRFELRGNNTKLVLTPAQKQVSIKFNDCFFLDTCTADKTIVSVVNLSCVRFVGCEFNESSTGLIKFLCNNNVANYGENGNIEFEECALDSDWSSRCSFTGLYGRISAINCRGTSVGAPTAGVHEAFDFDLGPEETAGFMTMAGLTTGTSLKSMGSSVHNGLRIKVAQIKIPTDFWPDITEHTLLLPKNAILLGGQIRKSGSGTGDGILVSFKIGRNDKTGTPHIMTNYTRMDGVHWGDADDLFYNVGNTTNERTLRLYTDENPAAGIQGGAAWVYYV